MEIVGKTGDPTRFLTKDFFSEILAENGDICVLKFSPESWTQLRTLLNALLVTIVTSVSTFQSIMIENTTMHNSAFMSSLLNLPDAAII